MNKEEIYNYCKKITTKENIEFIYINSFQESYEINKFSIDNYNQNIQDRLFIRIIEKNNIGKYNLQNISKTKIDFAIKKAKEIAKLKKSDIKYKEFGNSKSGQKIKYDDKIENIPFSEIISKIKPEIKKEKYITGYLGDVNKSKYESFYINPYTEKEKKIDSIYLGISVNTKNKKKSSGSFSNIFTRVKDINFSQTIEQAKINAYNLLDPIDGSSGEYTLILTPECTKDLVNFILGGTTAEAIHLKKSFLHNKGGKEIFSKNFSIIENPNLDYFLNSCNIDDEGFKTTQKDIFNKGIFKKPIYDLYNSLKYNKRPTGNGFLSNNYSAKYTNKIQIAGNKKIDDIILKTKKGILVYDLIGFHTNKLTTGDFSITISAGKIIENGEFKNTITNLNFAGNFLEVLKEVYFSKEQKFFGNSLFSFMIIPKIKII
jgi:predicted Zn-dependent protease